jgi:hypothetical protein
MYISESDSSLINRITEKIYKKEIILGIPNSEHQPHIMFYLDNLSPDPSLTEKQQKYADSYAKQQIIKYMVRIEHTKFAAVWLSICKHIKFNTFEEAFIEHLKINLYLI